MSKKKNTLKKEESKKARLKKKKRTKTLVITVICAVIAVITAVAVFTPKKNGVIFEYKEGAYVDPTTDKVYCPANQYAYLIKTRFYEKNYYGRMGENKVYTIPGTKGKSWLVSCLGNDLYELYYEESVHLPNIEEFEATMLYLCEGEPPYLNWEEIKDENELDSIVSILANGEKIETVDEFVETYSLRFISEKYNHMYFCFEYVITESGSYFYDHTSFSYIKANGILDGYVASLKESGGE